jgi:hypothetical protein
MLGLQQWQLLHVEKDDQGYDHVVLLLALIKLDYNLTSTSSLGHLAPASDDIGGHILLF